MKTNLGVDGEKIAADYLKNKGYIIVAMNYTNTLGKRLGEIDIIAKEKDVLVFVEVKTRNSEKYSQTLPEENITPSKIHKLSKIANQYLYKNNLQNINYRFDAVSIWLDYQTRKAKIKHLESIYL